MTIQAETLAAVDVLHRCVTRELAGENLATMKELTAAELADTRLLATALALAVGSLDVLLKAQAKQTGMSAQEFWAKWCLQWAAEQA